MFLQPKLHELNIEKNNLIEQKNHFNNFTNLHAQCKLKWNNVSLDTKELLEERTYDLFQLELIGNDVFGSSFEQIEINLSNQLFK